MPTALPMPTKAVGDVFTTTLWNSNLRDNINKLLNTGHRVLTVAQFAALGAPEGTKGTVAPDEVYLEVDSTNGIQWHLAYESGETTYKWRFLGGPAMYSEVLTNEHGASATYAALPTAGPAIALSRAGDYIIAIGFYLPSPTGTLGLQYMSYDIGGTGAVDADAVIGQGVAATTPLATMSRERVKTAIAASSTITAKYKQGAGDNYYQNRWMKILPVRII